MPERSAPVTWTLDDVRVLLDPTGHPFCRYLHTES
jgi:hypothetical protein